MRPRLPGAHALQPELHARTLQGLLGVRVDEGMFGDVPLAGTRAVIAFDTPQRMIDGGWLQTIIIDEGASDAQRRALEAILMGHAGGPWEKLAAFVATRQPTEFRAIAFEDDGAVKRASIVDRLKTVVTQIRGRDKIQAGGVREHLQPDSCADTGDCARRIRVRRRRGEVPDVRIARPLLALRVAGQRPGLGAGGDVMAGHAHAAAGIAFWQLSLMWFGMMAAMMAPTAWPWVHAFHRVHGVERDAAAGATVRFASGYLLAWFVYAIGAALLQRALQETTLMQPPSEVVVPRLGAVIFLIAGFYQFAPLKRACLTHCRTPLGYFLTRWHNGPISAFRMGLHHGLFCVGCCWALMATAFAVGVMNAWWMTALGLLALVEQIVPQGHRLRRVLGSAFLVAGIWRLGVLR